MASRIHIVSSYAGSLSFLLNSMISGQLSMHWYINDGMNEQHEMVGPDMQEMMPHGQMNIPMNGSHSHVQVQPQSNEGGDQYDCKQPHPQLNVQWFDSPPHIYSHFFWYYPAFPCLPGDFYMCNYDYIYDRSSVHRHGLQHLCHQHTNNTYIRTYGKRQFWCSSCIYTPMKPTQNVYVSQ